MKHTIKEWVAVTRYWSFPVSVAPVVATFAFLCSRHMLPHDFPSVLNFVLALLGVVILHSAGNVLSDWFDYRSGVDNENAFAVPNLVFGKFKPEEYFTFSIVLFAIGVAIGVVITLLSGPALLLIGGIGVLLTAAYSFLKYHALGDLDIFIIFGMLPVLGTSYAVTGAICPEALVLSLPIGIITVSVLHANNTFDTESDKAAGIRTFAMLIGGKTSCRLYQAYMIIPFVCIAVAVIAGALHPCSLLCLIAALPAFRNFSSASHYDTLGIKTMSGLDQGSAKMQLLFSGLLSIGLFTAALI